ncbi:uncharacterized protein K460DRAFT_416229 [Cucurbitaria berberidis CBS 394.84]|uniref:Secreted protein n=1 Tax=Cucurbitaria berberidis CBS 394.84 TaxID=1168544 RepID=A0A9P4L7B4_9PLEO|nr:uncharacterized protein K460DRAFT_416229 [Cucurbitaria berberidis CBS 394.84]KAF1844866.1 hypothetical protein K460DRAFT_416229 [Cucurbitaria berberidis CBS 394.84]
MSVKLRIFAMLCLISMTLVASLPHTGMINDEFVRDVGAVYTEPGYGGKASFLLALKAEPKCMPFDGNIASVQVCVTASCTFYPTEGCEQDSDSSSFTVNGPGDVQDVYAHVHKSKYGSYICGTDETVITKGKDTLPTTPHDSSKDKKPVMVLETTEHDESKELKSAAWQVPSSN